MFREESCAGVCFPDGRWEWMEGRAFALKDFLKIFSTGKTTLTFLGVPVWPLDGHFFLVERVFGCPSDPAAESPVPSGQREGTGGAREGTGGAARPPGLSRGRSPPRCLFSFSSVIKSFLKA